MESKLMVVLSGVFINSVYRISDIEKDLQHVNLQIHNQMDILQESWWGSESGSVYREVGEKTGIA